MKRAIRLTESDLKHIIKKSVGKILRETGYRGGSVKDCRNGDFPIESPEWTKDPRWDGWNGEDPEFIIQKKKEKGLWGESRRRSNGLLREFGSDGPDWDEPRVYNDFDYDDFYSRMSPTGPSQSANDFDTDEQLLNLNGEDFDDESLELGGIQDLDLESKRRMGRIIRESIRKVLRENDDEWRESYRDDKGNIFQSKGSGPKKQWRTLKDNKKGTQPKAGKYDDNEWREAYRDDKGNRIQSKGHGPNKQFRTIKSDNK